MAVYVFNHIFPFEICLEINKHVINYIKNDDLDTLLHEYNYSLCMRDIHHLNIGDLSREEHINRLVKTLDKIDRLRNMVLEMKIIPKYAPHRRRMRIGQKSRALLKIKKGNVDMKKFYEIFGIEHLEPFYKLK